MADSPLSTVLERLHDRKLQKSGSGWVALCPGHDDRHKRSLSISQGTDGRVLLKCFSGCAAADVARALGLEMKDLFAGDGAAGLQYTPPRASTAAAPAPSTAAETKPELVRDEDDDRRWPIAATYDYLDTDGAVVFQVVRKEPAEQRPGEKKRKTFRQRRPDGSGGWIHEISSLEARPLYRLPELTEDIAHDRTILLVEGERDVESLRALGFAATTNAGGSKNWRADYATQLHGARVVIIPDDDDPGRSWASDVGTSLIQIGDPVRMLALPSTGPGSDASDWVGAGGTREQLERYLEAAVPWTIGDPVPQPPAPSRFRMLTDTEIESMPPLEYLIDEMLPSGSLTAVFGSPSAGKSFVVLHMLCCVATGIPFLGREVQTGGVLYVAAEGSAGMRQRVTAWKEAHGFAGQPINAHFITEPANLMDGSDSDHVLRAVRALPHPPRLLVFDTLHRSMPGGEENSAKDVGVVINHLDRIRRLTGVTVLLVHHSRKESDTERGSTALRGAVDTMLLVREVDGERSLLCEKQKDAEPFDEIRIDLQPTLDSCVVRLTSAEAARSNHINGKLTKHQLGALSALAHDFGAEGASATEWQRAAEGRGVAERTLYRVKQKLLSSGLVHEVSGKGPGKRFLVTATGHSSLTLGYMSVEVSLSSDRLTPAAGSPPSPERASGGESRAGRGGRGSQQRNVSQPKMSGRDRQAFEREDEIPPLEDPPEDIDLFHSRG
jgi:hypothetical protein